PLGLLFDSGLLKVGPQYDHRLVPPCSALVAHPASFVEPGCLPQRSRDCQPLRHERYRAGSAYSWLARARSPARGRSRPRRARCRITNVRYSGLIEQLQAVTHRIGPPGWSADPEAEPGKALPEDGDQRRDPVLPARAAIAAQAHLPDRQVEVVVDRENVGGT